MWTFMDIFIMILSVGLSHQFSILNENLQKTQNHDMNQEFWTKRRGQYRKLCDLVAFIDQHISSIIFISFANNLFFICVQLLRTLR